MRRFLITSEKFTGTAELTYNEKGTICRVDMTDTNLDEQTVRHFLRAIGASILNLQQGFGAGTLIVEGDFEITFEVFWKDYPLHRNRYKVEKVWAKMNKTEQVKAFYSLHDYKKYLSKNQWQTPMIADNYLRNREYETEWKKL